MSRRSRKVGVNDRVSLPLGASPVGSNGLWRRLLLAGSTASTTSTDDGGGNTFQVNTSDDSDDPDTSSGVADYPQYSVVKVTGDPGSDRGKPKKHIRYSWPVMDIFGRKVTKMDAPYIHLFLFDLPMSEAAASGMQDPWKGAGSSIGTSGDGRPIGDNRLTIGFGISERPANDDYTSGVSSDRFPMIGAVVYEQASLWRLYALQSTGIDTGDGNIKPSATGNERIRSFTGSIQTGPDHLLSIQSVAFKSTDVDDQTLIYGKSLVEQTDVAGSADQPTSDVSSDDDICWTLWIGRNTSGRTADDTVAFNVRVMSIPMNVMKGPDGSWDDLFPMEYVSGAGGADGS
jgi:hypothetical protein